MQRDSRVRIEPRGHRLRFVGREVVGDEVDLPARGLRRDHTIQDLQKRGAGVPGSGHSFHGAGRDVQRATSEGRM